MSNDKTVAELRSHGYAVIIMSPADLQGAEAKTVESRGVEVVTAVIEDLVPVDQDDPTSTMRG